MDEYLISAFEKLDQHVSDSFDNVKVGINIISDENEKALRKVSEHYNEELERQGRESAEIYEKIQKKIDDKLNKLPETLEKLDEISEIPNKLNNLIESINQQLDQTTKSFSSSLDRNMSNFISNLDSAVSSSLSNMSVDIGKHNINVDTKIPRKFAVMMYVLVGLVSVSSISVACLVAFKLMEM